MQAIIELPAASALKEGAAFREELHALRISVRTAKQRELDIDRNLFRIFFKAGEDKRARHSVDFTSSMDTALSLLEHVFPGWTWHGTSWSGSEDGQPRARIQIARPKLMTWNFFTEAGMGACGEASTPALAVIDAVLAALIAQAEAEADRVSAVAQKAA